MEQRRIKFRGRGKQDEKLYFGSLVAGDIIVDNIPFVSETELTYDKGGFHECDHIGQWTGLVDKAGRDIYEGDVVWCSKWGYEYEVVWDSFSAAFAIYRKAVGMICFDSEFAKAYLTVVEP
jgi:hypothetical protein